MPLKEGIRKLLIIIICFFIDESRIRIMVNLKKIDIFINSAVAYFRMLVPLGACNSTRELDTLPNHLLAECNIREWVTLPEILPITQVCLICFVCLWLLES